MNGLDVQQLNEVVLHRLGDIEDVVVAQVHDQVEDEHILDDRLVLRLYQRIHFFCKDLRPRSNSNAATPSPNS